MEVIILAGGKGTRLASVLNEKPKCLADINGKPFLSYIMAYLEDQGAAHVILSLGHQYEQVIDWLRSKAFTFKVSWVIEQEPLGTGGGIKRALHKSKADKVIVINGDTYFPIDLSVALAVDIAQHKALLCLKNMLQPDRYGTVLLDSEDQIIGFREKESIEAGLINAGTYIINKKQEDFATYPESFSLEKDFLERHTDGSLKGHVFDEYFIDIGIPKDYEAFQKLMQ